MISLLKVAEEVNKLDEMFKTLATQYSTEVDHRSKILGKLIEPILIIFIAGFVAIILIAMYLPLFELSKVVGG